MICPRICSSVTFIFNTSLDDLWHFAVLTVLHKLLFIRDQIQSIFYNLHFPPHIQTDQIQDLARPIWTFQFSKMHSELNLSCLMWWRNWNLRTEKDFDNHSDPFSSLQEKLFDHHHPPTLPPGQGRINPIFKVLQRRWFHSPPAISCYWNISFMWPGYIKPIFKNRFCQETSP